MKIRVENQSELMQAGISFYDVLELQKIARSLHRADEYACMYDRTERGYKMAETRERNQEIRANEIAQKYGLKAYHQGDCRGWPLYLITEEQDDSNYSKGLAVCPH